MTGWGKRKDGQAYPKELRKGIRGSITNPTKDVTYDERFAEQQMVSLLSTKNASDNHYKKNDSEIFKLEDIPEINEAITKIYVLLGKSGHYKTGAVEITDGLKSNTFIGVADTPEQVKDLAKRQIYREIKKLKTDGTTIIINPEQENSIHIRKIPLYPKESIEEQKLYGEAKLHRMALRIWKGDDFEDARIYPITKFTKNPFFT